MPMQWKGEYHALIARSGLFHAWRGLPSQSQLLRSHRERPRRCSAAEECDEVAPSHSNRPLRAKAYQRAALCVTAKLAAKCSDGSFSTDRLARAARAMSALPPIATGLMRHSETSRCANSRHMQRSKLQSIRSPRRGDEQYQRQVEGGFAERNVMEYWFRLPS